MQVSPTYTHNSAELSRVKFGNLLGVFAGFISLAYSFLSKTSCALSREIIMITFIPRLAADIEINATEANQLSESKMRTHRWTAG